MVKSTQAIQLLGLMEDVWNWNEHIEFDIDVKDIARGARLCLGIYALYSGKGKGKKKGYRKVSWYLQFQVSKVIISVLRS